MSYDSFHFGLSVPSKSVLSRWFAISQKREFRCQVTKVELDLDIVVTSSWW